MKSWLHRSGLVALLRWLRRRQVTVLMYHGVVKDEERLAEGDWLQVRRSEFAAQMSYLRRHYHVVSLQQALSEPDVGKRPRAVITFDDGYANNLEVALPILEDFEFPATLFLTTGLIGTQAPFWWDRLRLAAWPEVVPPEAFTRLKALPHSQLESALEAHARERGWRLPSQAPPSYRILNREEVVHLARHPLVTLGSHTHYHEILTRLEPEAVMRTLRLSKAFLAELGVDTPWFAAPNGDFRPDLIPCLLAAGFSVNLTTAPGLWRPPESLFAIPRLGVGRGMTVDEFAVLLLGLRRRMR